MRAGIVAMAVAAALVAGYGAWVDSTVALGDKISVEALTYSGKVGPVPARLYLPQGPGPFAGVLVLHTSGGTEPEVEEYAEALAKEGFAALAVDYFAARGASRNDPNKDWSGQVADLSGAVEYLLSRAEVKKDGIGAVGFSLGSQRAMQISGARSEVKAVVGYYGPYDPMQRLWVPEVRRARAPSALSEAARTSAAVLLLHGDRDLETPVGEAQAMAKALKEAGKSVELVIYSKAGHRFNFRRAEGRPDRGGGILRFDSKATTDAFRRTVAFLRQQLVG
jgi:carboxymethylenebutenolidase